MSATIATPQPAAVKNPLREPGKHGESVWSDFIRRGLFPSGELQHVIDAGVFLQVTCDGHADLPVPGRKFTFGVVKAAQARGDFQVLAERNRRPLRVHLSDVESGWIALGDAIEKALA